MKSNFDYCLPKFLRHEGGYVDHPRDPGGATNMGVTIANFRRYVKRNGTKADLRRITREQVAKVFKAHYWDKVKGDALPSGVDYAVADFAINSGPSRAAKYLQAVVGVKQDGKIGPATLTAVDAMDPATIVKRLCANRLAFMKRLRIWSTFGRGWKRRVDEVRRESLKMIKTRQKIEPAKRQKVTEESKPKIQPSKTLLDVIIVLFKAIFGGKK